MQLKKGRELFFEMYEQTKAVKDQSRYQDTCKKWRFKYNMEVPYTSYYSFKISHSKYIKKKFKKQLCN